MLWLFWFGFFLIFLSLPLFVCLFYWTSCVRNSLTDIISILKLSNELKLAKEKGERIYSLAVSFKLLYVLIVLFHAKCNFNDIESTD